MGKDERKEMHKAIREHLPTLESSTEDSENGGKKIVVQKAGNSSKRQGIVHMNVIEKLFCYQFFQSANKFQNVTLHCMVSST